MTIHRLPGTTLRIIYSVKYNDCIFNLIQLAWISRKYFSFLNIKVVIVVLLVIDF